MKLWDSTIELFGFMSKTRFNYLYKTHYNICDSILSHLEKDNLITPTSFRNKVLLGEELSQKQASIRTLAKDGYIIPSDDDTGGIITGTGIFFIRKGGYKEMIKRDFRNDKRIQMQSLFNFWVMIGTVSATVIAYFAYKKKDEIRILEPRVIQAQKGPLKITIQDTPKVKLVPERK